MKDRRIHLALLRGLLFFICLVPLNHLSFGQVELSPDFGTFEGDVYILPHDSLSKGFRPYVEKLAPVKHISWNEISIWESTSKIPFPDVRYRDLFGIIFTTDMKIAADGMYEFILVSDDGSKLWIDGELILDNDFPHPMQIKRDTVLIREGNYPIKIWYYQAYPNRYGMIFKANYIGEAVEGIALRDSFSWDSDILFEFDSYELTDEGVDILNQLLTQIHNSRVDKIKIAGHTDDRGTGVYNDILSIRRAEAIRSFLRTAGLSDTIELITSGHGENQPRVENDSASNRAKNRRVELIFE